MKDEYGGKLIKIFIGLKSKMYSILDENDNEKSTNKGYNAFIEFKEFDDTLFQKKILRHKMRGVISKNHNVGTYEANKISLSCFDDKRYILRNGINTLAYGHKDISLMKNEYIYLIHPIINKNNNFSNIRNHYLMEDKQCLQNIETLIEKSMINKINEFEQSIMKNNKFNDPYELNNLILQRHFLIKTFKEINKELKKDNRQFRIDFDNNAYDYFDEQNYYYLKYKGCITDNDELLYFKVREELYALDLLIKNLLFLICIHKMSIHMSIKEYMKDLNTLKPEHDLLTI